MKQRLTIVVGERRKRKLVHVIPFDDDAITAEEPGKKSKTTFDAESSAPLSSLEKDGLQALLSLGSPIHPLEGRSNAHGSALTRLSEKRSADTCKVSQTISYFKLPDLTRNTIPIARRTIQEAVGKPLLPPPVPRYLERPIAPPPGLPRIAYGCIFSRESNTMSTKKG
ncbi:hypothetical protein IV203_006263 [Nitzschia inconspicua]|uniref:Uncharacterized protein n=1 Tax=Nitzschia inconspicua TaxID=303405 RepID=A0A9K3KP25_9STRA|nr:hypothetical protein IV203_006263 [Nitzschia inconspicua]